MRIQLATSTDALPDLRSDWNRLANGIPMRTWDWLASWWEHYGAGRELCVALAVDETGAVRGVAPWYREASTAKGTTLAFLGSGEVCSDYLGILAEPQCEPGVCRALAEFLAGEFASQWDLLHLTGVAADEPSVHSLATAVQEQGLTCHEKLGLNTWRIELPAQWEGYIETLSKSHRKQVRRVDRRLVESGEAQLRLARTPEELASGMRVLIDLHQRRRASLGEPGCFADARFEGFLRAAASRLLESDQLRLFWIELRGVPVAAEFQLAGGGVTYAYQAGLDPDALDDEPGRIINVATLKHAIESGQRAFDFLRGDEPYKAHWRAEPHASRELRIVPRTTTAQLRHNLWLAGDTMKQWLKSGLKH